MKLPLIESVETVHCIVCVYLFDQDFLWITYFFLVRPASNSSTYELVICIFQLFWFKFSLNIWNKISKLLLCYFRRGMMEIKIIWNIVRFFKLFEFHSYLTIKIVSNIFIHFEFSFRSFFRILYLLIFLLCPLINQLFYFFFKLLSSKCEFIWTHQHFFSFFCLNLFF